MFAPSPLLTACVFLNRAGRQKEWWDNIVCLDNFALHSLTFFSIKSPFLGWTRDPWYCSPQTDVRPVDTAALMRLLKQSREAKRMVR
jgi:hypothetical protein